MVRFLPAACLKSDSFCDGIDDVIIGHVDADKGTTWRLAEATEDDDEALRRGTTQRHSAKARRRRRRRTTKVITPGDADKPLTLRRRTGTLIEERTMCR